MWRIAPIVLLLASACVAQPPERSPLPDVGDVLPEPLGCQLGVGDPKGVAVLNVISGTPAEGVLGEGDLIVEVENAPVEQVTDLFTVMERYHPGDTVSFEIERDDGSDTAKVTLAANPNDETRAFIGINIETAIDRISLDDADDVVTPSPTARPIELAGRLFLIDPLLRTWQPLGVDTPDNPRWVSTDNGIYTMSQPDGGQVFDVLADEPIEDDGFQGWDPRQVIGAVGNRLVLLVTSAATDGPGQIGIAGFSPLTGTTQWVLPASSTFGVPVAAIAALDDSSFLVVGADAQGSQTGLAVHNSSGMPLEGEVPVELGNPLGWFDVQSHAFQTTGDSITAANLIEGTTTTYSLPQDLIGSAITTVGDGMHILAISGRDLVLYDLTNAGDRLDIATNCSIGRRGDPGWGGQ